jgi:hypothetical protein
MNLSKHLKSTPWSQRMVAPKRGVELRLGLTKSSACMGAGLGKVEGRGSRAKRGQEEEERVEVEGETALDL